MFFDKMETLDDLFEMQLKDLYSAENQLVKALPMMAEKAKDGRLRAGFERHLRETESKWSAWSALARASTWTSTAIPARPWPG
jgi:ferritin-like metal-binding protein YciE